MHDKMVRDKYDVVIVGGGPAGFAAGLVLARARHSVLVIETEDAGVVVSGPDHRGHPTVGRDEVRDHGGEVVAAKVVSVQKGDAKSTDAKSTDAPSPDARVVLADGRSVTARRLLTVPGPTAELPDVPGLAERWGRDVLHCPYCHGWEIRDQAIGVLSTGPSAVSQALLFRQWSATVTLFLHTGPEPTNAQWRQLAARDIGVVDGEVVGLELEQDRLIGIRLHSGPVLASQALVVVPTWALSEPDTRTDAELDTEPDAETGAQADPVAAALALSEDLIAEDIARAVAGHHEHEPFSAESERHVHNRVIGHRRHGW